MTDDHHLTDPTPSEGSRPVTGSVGRGLDDEREMVVQAMISDIDLITQLDEIERFVVLVARDGSPAYSTRTCKWRMGVSLVKTLIFRSVPQYLNLYNPDLVYSPRVRLFFDALLKPGCPGPIFTDPSIIIEGKYTYGEFFNALIAKIHERANSRDFKERLRKAEYGHKRLFKEYKQYNDALFKCHAKLLVVRVDLRYRPQIAQSHSGMLDRLETDLRVFKRGMRRSTRHPVFSHQVGYIQVLEYGEKSGYHCHFVLYFNGAKRSHDCYIARQIGFHWKMISERDGIAFSSNCNFKMQASPNYGVGMVNRSDKRKQRLLKEKVIGYLFKTEQYLRVRNSPKSNRFSRGKWPKCRRPS